MCVTILCVTIPNFVSVKHIFEFLIISALHILASFLESFPRWKYLTHNICGALFFGDAQYLNRFCVCHYFVCHYLGDFYVYHYLDPIFIITYF